MELVKKLVHVLADIIYLCIGAYAIVCLPMLAGYKPLVVLSGSMEPTFSVGSVIYYQSFNESDLKVGDIITYKLKDNKTLVSHRINSIEEGLIETKGDANNVADSQKITADSIIGVVAGFYFPYIGYYIRFVNERLYLVACAVVILMSEFVLSNIDFSKKKGKEIENGN